LPQAPWKVQLGDLPLPDAGVPDASGDGGVGDAAP